MFSRSLDEELCTYLNMCCTASCSLHSKSAAHGEVGPDEWILLFWENWSCVFALSFPPLPSLVLPCRSLSASFVYPGIFGCLGCQPVRNPLFALLWLSFLLARANWWVFGGFFAKWLNSSDDARISHAKLLQSEVKRNDPIVVKWVWSGRGSFCNNVTYIPLTIMGFSKREISGVEFTAAAEFSTPHNPSFKN